MIGSLIQKLEQRDQLSDEEKTVLRAAPTRIREIEAGQNIITEGSRPTSSTLLLDGITARYNLLENGKRQITSLHVAGDFIDLHGFLLKTMNHSIVALSPCRIALVPHDTLRVITETHPHLTRLLWLTTIIDGGIHRAWIVAMGRRSSLGQMAHLFCELYLRLRGVGLTRGYSYHFPLTQAEVGDVLGLSTVHVNRVVQELRGRDLIAWRGDLLEILDWNRLVGVAEFDPSYLNINYEPR